jgi:hypothetical protein
MAIMVASFRDSLMMARAHPAGGSHVRAASGGRFIRHAGRIAALGVKRAEFLREQQLARRAGEWCCWRDDRANARSSRFPRCL